MKKVLSLTLSFVMIVTTLFSLPILAHAETPASGTLGTGIEYTFDSETGTLTLSVAPDGTGIMDSFSSGRFGSDNTDIKKVIIGEGIKTIGSYALSHLTAMTEIVFPSTLEKIGFYSISYADSLESVVIPDSVEVIDGSAFGYCPNLKTVHIGKNLRSMTGSSFDTTSMLSFDVDKENLYYSDIDGNLYNANGTTIIMYCAGKTDAEFTIPENVSKISGYAFSSCTTTNPLKKVILPSGLKRIDGEAFRGASSLNEIVMPEGLEVISNGAFEYCSGLTSINIPSTVTEIGRNAFDDTKITQLNIPKSVTKISEGTFGYMYYLEAFNVDAENPVLKAEDGVLFSKDGKILYNYPCAKESTAYTIPDGVEIVQYLAFTYSNKLKTVTFPSTLKKLCRYSFLRSAITGDIVIPESVDTIETSAFSNCSRITSVTVNNPYCSIDSNSNTLPVNKPIKSYNKCDGTASAAQQYCEKNSYTYEALGTVAHKYGAFVSNGNGTHSKTCVNCGDVQSASCSMTSLPGKAATCTQAGYGAGERCTVCGYSTEVETLDPLGHDEHKTEQIITPATCSSKGLKRVTTTCSRCEYTNVTEQVIYETAHTYETAPEVPATCTEDGLTEGTYCKVCGYWKVNQKKILAAGHAWNDGVVTTPATCTADGIKTYTCTVCGETKTEVLAKLSHTYTNKVTPATTTADGRITPTCTCGAKKTATPIYKASSISLSKTAFTYNGKVQKPSVTVKNSKGTTLKYGTDYTVTYSSGCKNTGKYAVKVTFKGHYTGSKTLYFTILPGITSKIVTATSSSAVKLTWKAVPGATGYRVYVYNASTKKYTALKTTTATSYTVTKLKSATSYKFAVKAYLTVGSSTYWSAGYQTVTATTNPGTPTLKVTAGTKKASLSWSKQTGATGYVVYMATSKNGKYTKIATLNGSTKVSFTKTGLTKGKTYYFKVAAYKTVSGKNIYGSFSSVGYAKIK